MLTLHYWENCNLMNERDGPGTARLRWKEPDDDGLLPSWRTVIRTVVKSQGMTSPVLTTVLTLTRAMRENFNGSSSTQSTLQISTLTWPSFHFISLFEFRPRIIGESMGCAGCSWAHPNLPVRHRLPLFPQAPPVAHPASLLFSPATAEKV